MFIKVKNINGKYIIDINWPGLFQLTNFVLKPPSLYGKAYLRITGENWPGRKIYA